MQTELQDQIIDALSPFMGSLTVDDRSLKKQMRLRLATGLRGTLQLIEARVGQERILLTRLQDVKNKLEHQLEHHRVANGFLHEGVWQYHSISSQATDRFLTSLVAEITSQVGTTLAIQEKLASLSDMSLKLAA